MSNKKYNRKTSDEKKQEIIEISEQALAQIEKYSKSPEAMLEYANFLARFHSYSANNMSLIQQQFPGAVAVASFKDWKDKGYSVNKGEKGSKILNYAPVTLFKNAAGETKQLSYATAEEKKQVKDNTLSSWKVKNFKIGHVFDVSQTNAPIEDLPKIFPNKQFNFQVEDGHNATYLKKGIDAVAKELSIEIKDMKHSAFGMNELGSAKGVFVQAIDSDQKEILLNSRNTETQNLATSIHELAHARLHDKSLEVDFDKPTKEFQAELTSYIVCKHYGMDTSEKAIPYIAAWTENGAKLEDKQKAVEGVHIASKEFIDTIDNVIANEQTLEMEGVKSEMNYHDELHMIQESYSLLPNELDLEDKDFWNKVGAEDPEAYEKYLTYGALYKHEQKHGESHFEKPVMFIHGVSDEFKPFGEMNNIESSAIKTDVVEYTVALVDENGEMKTFSGKYDKTDYTNPLHHMTRNEITDDETFYKLQEDWHDHLIAEENDYIDQWRQGAAFQQIADNEVEPGEEHKYFANWSKDEEIVDSKGDALYPMDPEEVVHCDLTGKAIAQDEGYYQVDHLHLSEEAHKLIFSKEEWDELYTEDGEYYYSTMYYDSPMTNKEPESTMDKSNEYYHYDGQSEPVRLGTLPEILESAKKQEPIDHFSIDRTTLFHLGIAQDLPKDTFSFTMEEHGILKNPTMKDFEKVNEKQGLDKHQNLSNLKPETEDNYSQKAHAFLNRSIER